MRRKEKLREDENFFNYVFKKAEEIYLAFMDEDFPYCLPFNFVKTGNSIYLHCAPEGHKLNCIRKNPNVAFALACDIEIDRAKSSTWFKSVAGTGQAIIVSSLPEKENALQMLAARYNSQCKPLSATALEKNIAIIRIDIKSVTGKNSVPK